MEYNSLEPTPRAVLTDGFTDTDIRYEGKRANMETIMSTYSSSIFFSRWAALVIDFIILICLTVGFVFLLQDYYYQWGFLVILMVIFGYYLFLEAFTGFTVGKFALRIRVVNAEGNSPGFVKVLIRTLLRIVDTNPALLGGLPAGITVLVSKNKQRLGDMAAKTYVANLRDLKPISKRSTIKYAASFTVLAVASIVFAILGLMNIETDGKKIETFHSKDRQFQITTPNSSWSENSNLHDQADISIANLFAEKYLIVLSESKADFESGFTLDDYEYYLEEDFAAELSADVLYRPYATYISEYPAYKFAYKAEMEGESIAYIFSTVETPTHFHKIIAWTLSSKYDQLQVELHEVIDSFKEAEQLG